jgi:hypothetical protein
MFFVMLLVSGCAQPKPEIISPQELTVSPLGLSAPTLDDPARTQVTRMSITVLPVRGPKVKDNSWRKLLAMDTKVFRRALEKSLAQTRLFTVVDSPATAKFQLQAVIVFDEPLDFYAISMPLLVKYEIFRTTDRARVFAANVFSEPRIPCQKSGHGIKSEICQMPYNAVMPSKKFFARHAQMRRAAIKDNFEKLIIRISAAFAAKRLSLKF